MLQKIQRKLQRRARWRPIALIASVSGAMAFAATFAQLSGCAEAATQETVDAAADVVFHPRPNGGDASTIVCNQNPCVVDVALGGNHTCALLGDGTVRCWGDNVAGELGTAADAAAAAQTSTPIMVSGVAGAVGIAAGGMFSGGATDYDVSCAATASGPLCWGSNEYEMLGWGSSFPADSAMHTTPSAVVMSTAGMKVALGQTHGCAFGGSNFICWGSNEYEQLGVGLLDAGSESPTPVSVTLPGGKKAVETVLGFAHTCVLTDDQTVACWGYDGEDECGAPPPSGYELPTPTIVSGLAGVVHLAAGSYHTCALTIGGDVLCWGYNYQGLLGGGSDGGTMSASPVQVALPSGHKAASIAAGTYSTCAALDDGTVACWGYDTYGQVGFAPDASTEIISTPTLIAGVGAVVQVAMGAGSQHVCARTFGGGLKCWGSNEYGQLGATTSEAGVVGSMSTTPVDVVF